MNQPLTIEDIQRATHLGTRAVREWIRRLSIVPTSVRGRVHLYPPTVVAEIQAAQIRQSLARRARASSDITHAPSTTPATGVITLEEATARAKGGKS